MNSFFTCTFTRCD